MKIKSSIELHSASNSGGTMEDMIDGEADEAGDDDEKYIDAFGTLALRDGGAATFYGRSAGQESLLIVSPSLSSASLIMNNFQKN